MCTKFEPKQRESLLQRVAAAEGEASLARAVLQRASSSPSSLTALARQRQPSSREHNNAATGAVESTPPPSTALDTDAGVPVPADQAAVLAATAAAAETALAAARSDVGSARSELGLARAELDALRARLAEEEGHRQELERQFELERARRESSSVVEARAAAVESAARRDKV